MRSRGAITLAGVVLALALTSCAGIGSVSQTELTAEAQQRGGGVTTGLVDAAIAAIADETGQDPLTVESITATLAQVTIVVPGNGAWTYGTSGLYGGRGLTGPVATGSGGRAFPVAVGDLDVDAAGATARDAVGPGTWVETVAVALSREGDRPQLAVAVTDGVTSATVVVDATGAIVVEGLR